MEFEKIMEYKLAGATGYDCDDTLLMIRTLELNQDEIANDKKLESMLRDVLLYIYREYSSTTLNLWEINTKDFLKMLMLAKTGGE